MPKVAVVEKAVSLGSYSPLLSEIRSVFCGRKKAPVISGFVIGLGGRDITIDSVKEIFKRLTAKQISEEYIDLKPELLEENI